MAKTGIGNIASDVENLQRVDLYVDESGQDTKGRLFNVAVIAIEDSDKFRQLCQAAEEISGKGNTKWGKSDKNKRLVYLRTVIQYATSANVKLFYNIFRKTTDYDAATIEGIAKSIRVLRPSGSRVYVYVDGLTKTKRGDYKTRLRKLSCPVRKVSGVRRDENEPLIRLADAVAGASRDFLEHRESELREIDSELREIFALALQQGILVEL